MPTITYLYQATIEIQITNTDGHYDYRVALPCFLVMAPDIRTAEATAIRVASASASPRDLYRSRGTVIALTTDPAGETTGYPRTWDDIGADEETETELHCDECGAPFPDDNGRENVDPRHMESCSLHPSA